jgi:ribonucleoside-diphosphate reductase alpha chain
MHSYDEAFKASLEYFNDDELAAKIFVDKYALRNEKDELLEKTPTEMHWRLANEFARIEAGKYKKKSGIKPLSAQQVFDLMDNFKYLVPQGSPLSGIGNDFQITSLSNCYVLEAPQDSYSSILATDEQLVNVSKRRGGVGIDLSNLRPAGMPTKNSSKTSTGIVSWMERYSHSIREVGQNNRRGALMLTLSVHHPQILDFAIAKLDSTKVTGANISIKLTQEFLDAVESDSPYELRFPVDSNKPVVSKMVSAKEVWKKIIECAHKSAEPGLLMWDNILKGPADCYEQYRSTSTNPCSEIPMSELDSCRLMCLNLYSYVVNPFTKGAYFDYSLFYEHSQIAQRLMDDLVDLEIEKIDKILAKIESDPESDYIKDRERQLWVKIRKVAVGGRRTGLGITALGDTLAALELGYAEKEGMEATNEIYKTLKFGAYRASVDMARELGAFEGWEGEKEKECEFFNRFNDELIKLPLEPTLSMTVDSFVSGKQIYTDMQKYGRRNVALLTTAPTGTISNLTRTTAGIEPAYKLDYKRRKKISHGDTHGRVDFIDPSGDKWQEFVVYHPKITEWMKVTGETDLKKSPWYGYCAEELDWQKRVELQAIAQKHICHAISSTINLPEDVSVDEVAKIYETAAKLGCKGMTVYRDKCRTGVLVENTPEVKKPQKRPKELECDVYHITVSGTQYFVLVGIGEDKNPYEVFSGKNGFLDKSIKSGRIIRLRDGVYKAVFPDETELCPITASCSENEETITRLVSAYLRSNKDTHIIVQQLEKVQGSMNSFARSVARALKKYIPENTKEGELCPECKQELIRAEGCVKCISCTYSKCA